jgi:hypothetical protein
MVVMFKMSSEKKERFTHKIDKMLDFLEEFKDCLENSYEEEPEYRHDWEDYPEHEKERAYREMSSRYARMRKMGGRY